MKKVLTVSMTLLTAMFLTTGCSNWTHQEKGTAVGAVAGGVAGNLLTGGSVAGTAIGAVGGGLIGHEVTK